MLYGTSGHNSDAEILAELQKGDIEPAMVFARDRNALHLAVDSGRVALIQPLIDAGVPVNAQDDWGLTPLLIAASRSCDDCPELLRILLANGADARIINKDKESALRLYLQNRSWRGKSVDSDIFKNLLKAAIEGDLNPLITCVEYAQAEALPLFVDAIQQGLFNPQEQDAWGNNALHRLNRNPVLVKLLVDAGVPVNDRNNSGYTPLLYVATHHPDYQLLAALIDAGADALMTMPDGGTVLQLYLEYVFADSAFRRLDEKIIALLLNAGVSPEVGSLSGMSPLLPTLFYPDNAALRHIRETASSEEIAKVQPIAKQLRIDARKEARAKNLKTIGEWLRKSLPLVLGALVLTALSVYLERFVYKAAPQNNWFTYLVAPMMLMPLLGVLCLVLELFLDRIFRWSGDGMIGVGNPTAILFMWAGCGAGLVLGLVLGLLPPVQSMFRENLILYYLPSALWLLIAWRFALHHSRRFQMTSARQELESALSSIARSRR